MIGRTNIASGGGKINELIQDFLVSSSYSVNAGDFVQYIGNTLDGTDKVLKENETSYLVSAVAIDSSHVFIAYKHNDGLGNLSLRAVVCSMNDTTISTGDVAVLDSDIGISISAVSLGNGKVFISYSVGSSLNYLYGIVCNVIGTTISSGTRVQISEEYYSGYMLDATKLTDNKVFIAHSNTTNYRLYGITCTISGTSITYGTDTELSSTNYSCYKAVSAVTLEENKVYIARFQESTYFKPYGTLITITSNSYNIESDVQINSSSSDANSTIKAIALSKNYILYTLGRSYAAALVIKTNSTNTGIDSTGSMVTIDSTSATGMTLAPVKIIYNEINVFYRLPSSNGLKRANFTIQGTYINTPSSYNFVTGSNVASVVKYSGSYIFIAHNENNNYSLRGIVRRTYSAMPYAGTNPVIGVAKTGGTGGQTIDVYVPN